MPKLPKTSSISNLSASQVFIGIDPGQNGGLVAIFSSGKIEATPMPQTERDIWEWFRDLGNFHIAHAIIEKVHAMPGQGVTSMFTFGQGYGSVRMALIAAGIPFEETPPKAWQKALGIPPKKKEEEKGAWKNRLLSFAQQIHPSLPEWTATRAESKKKAIADALLIAEFCKRKHQGKL